MADESERRTVVDRYYTRGYVADINGGHREDQCVLLHSNKICVITVAPEHPLVKNGHTATSINFQVSAKVNRLDNQVVGKAKKGAQWLMPDSPLCEVTCSNGTKYVLYSCMKGKLIEVNQELLTKPELLNLKHETEGYIAVVLPKLQEVNLYFDKLMTPKDYEELLERRKQLLNENGTNSSPQEDTSDT